MCFAPQRRAFFDITTSKGGPNMVCFVHFDLEMCFRHNSVHFFDIATSKSGLGRCGLYILTWKCASHHNGVQLFISHLASWLCTRRFSEVTLRPSRATNHWQNTVIVTFLPFCAPASSFFSLLLLSDLLTFLLPADSSHLCFSMSPYCRKFDF